MDFVQTNQEAIFWGCVGGFWNAWSEYKAIKESNDESKQQVLKYKIFYPLSGVVKVILAGLLTGAANDYHKLIFYFAIGIGYFSEILLVKMFKQLPRFLSESE